MIGDPPAGDYRGDAIRLPDGRFCVLRVTAVTEPDVVLIEVDILHRGMPIELPSLAPGELTFPLVANASAARNLAKLLLKKADELDNLKGRSTPLPPADGG